jgi:membrane-associated phospholipid phosphatase
MAGMVDRSPRLMVLAAAGFVGAAVLLWAVAFETTRGIRLDARALEDFMDAGRHGIGPLAEVVARFADPLPFALLSAAVLAIALAGGGVRLAAIVGAVLLGACLTTEVLKQVTADPRGVELVPFAHVAPAGWPSGHTTAATALALCLVAVVPDRLRPLAVAVGGAFALAVAISVLVVGSHFPSDVLGGFCVAAAWTLCGLAAARATRARRTASSSPSP